MSVLKTNYKDDAWVGKRKYSKTDNSDGTISLDDVTEYTQEGDSFGAADINKTNAEVNKAYKVGDEEIIANAMGLGTAAKKDMTNNITEGSANPVSSGAVFNGLSQKANSTHNHNTSYYTKDEIDQLNTAFLTSVNASKTYAPISSPKFTGTPKAPTGTDYGTSRMRNISVGTAKLTDGESALASGDLYFTYV